MANMKHYVQIHAYMTADAIKNQLNEIKEADMFDENLRIFFNVHQMIGIFDIAYMLKYFDAKLDYDFSNENVVFIPQDWVIKNIKTDKDRFKF